ncbi:MULTISPECIES: catalase [unclassified Herbaspirillum]|uniref:catalase n=1 Tax=unclassified Herbaspirillum TaxID=2624150 RepID=UPI001150C028|nr:MULTISPECIES: catalase [unclassified Herbaspirillum]MBB5390463.1 catalase [Herbaspirillum sp. SJZ102]TQK09042.1 catalase [Herbaspirillum sp. SJZ130]TQK14271.1 catalase [Herbaspirillum sp. SJZ106]
MPTKKAPAAKKTSASGSGKPGSGSLLSTMSGPADGKPAFGAGEYSPTALLQKIAGVNAVSAGLPNNPAKPGEIGARGRTAPTGATVEAPDPVVHGSTVTEAHGSVKTGAAQPVPGANALAGSLDRVRADDSGQALTSNQGVPVSDNQNSLKAGLRGPTAMEDFLLREKITHFDHERIPERVVHARGSAAHGYFECYKALTELTCAAPFAEDGKRTPVFTRFSTVAGGAGSADTVRDVRGFAVKFYTDEGNWDLVGNNIPVFFIQDAMKFPDLVHALKPEPHFGMPQASSAHDTFWDFVSLMPESPHMLLWQMSDRAIPRSYRMMQGFGVHTFRLVNADGESVFCKFHWTPKAGTHSLIWDEAVKIGGADPDYHRRDLWEAIEAGAAPEWELSLQVFSEDEAEGMPFDILDPTKIVPEELVPLIPVGRMVLNRNPDNFFAETEQVAFCTAHIVPGIDFTNDPLLQGRIHSYLDTQISRLGGANFHELPINSPLRAVHNNQRDGMHRQTLHRGRVAYEPNSLGGGCPFQAGAAGFKSFPQPVEGDKIRAKPEKFADHYSQARLFWQSQTLAEQLHIVNAFRFELTRVQTPAVRQRVVSLLVNVDPMLAQQVAEGLGLEVPEAAPVLVANAPRYAVSPALSLTSYPGDTGIATRRVAVLAADGVDGAMLRHVYEHLLQQGAVPRLVGQKLGAITCSAGQPFQVEITLSAAPSALYDAVAIPDGEQAATLLAADPLVAEFVRDQYRHCKPLLVVGSASSVIDKAELPNVLPNGDDDFSLAVGDAGQLPELLQQFVEALAGQRELGREALA